jgi:hypothetical protein
MYSESTKSQQKINHLQARETFRSAITSADFRLYFFGGSAGSLSLY